MKATTTLSFRQYPLAALLAVPVTIGTFLAIGRWLGGEHDVLGLARPAPHALPTEWALVFEMMILTFMAATALRGGLLGSLLRSSDSPTWYGGVAVFTAGFFRHGYGPWGSGLSYYGIITWNLSSSGWSMALIAWPMVYGAIIAIASYLTIVSGRPSAYRWRWAVVGLFLAAIAITEMVFALQSSAWPDRTARVVSLGSAGLVLASLAIAARFAGTDIKRAHLMELVGALYMLPALDPRVTISGHTIPLGNALQMAGPGYWLQALGTVSMLARVGFRGGKGGARLGTENIVR